MRNKNARVIIPLALVAWVGGILISRDGVPDPVRAGFVAAFAITVPVVVFYLMADTGWGTLARRHRSRVPFRGDWRACPAAQMAMVSVEHQDYERHRLRMVSAVRVGITDASLYLSMLFERIPLLGRFFPDLQIDWSEVRSARSYEAPGWFRRGESGALVTANYDPNYTGRFIELEIGEPPVFLQLPASVLGEAEARLPLASRAGA